MGKGTAESPLFTVLRLESPVTSEMGNVEAGEVDSLDVGDESSAEKVSIKETTREGVESRTFLSLPEVSKLLAWSSLGLYAFF